MTTTRRFQRFALVLVAVTAALAATASVARAGVVTYTFAQQGETSFVVPNGVRGDIRFEATGEAGEPGRDDRGGVPPAGGPGAKVAGSLPGVAAGTRIWLQVAYGGGGAGGRDAGRGGNWSGVTTCSVEAAPCGEPLVVAGGGGGGGAYQGSGAGGAGGQPGARGVVGGSAAYGGRPGTSAGPGAGGTSPGGCGAGDIGGTRDGGTGSPCVVGGGGGGGGWHGGGGGGGSTLLGAAGGGGGGGSYLSAALRGQVAGEASPGATPKVVVSFNDGAVPVPRIDEPAPTLGVAEISGTAGTELGDERTVSVHFTHVATSTFFHTTATVGADGRFTARASGDLPAGEYIVSASQRDRSGNGGGSVQRRFVLDPEAPVVSITAPADGAGVDATPLFSGTAGTDDVDDGAIELEVERGSRVLLAGIAPVAADGSWSQRFTAPLEPGDYVVRASQRDSLGRTTTVTRAFTVPARPAAKLPQPGPATPPRGQDDGVIAVAPTPGASAPSPNTGATAPTSAATGHPVATPPTRTTRTRMAAKRRAARKAKRCARYARRGKKRVCVVRKAAKRRAARVSPARARG